MKQPVVLKFGGTSVAHPAALEIMCNMLRRSSNDALIIVVSALAGITDQLAELANESTTEARAEEILADIQHHHFSLGKRLISSVRYSYLRDVLRKMLNQLTTTWQQRRNSTQRDTLLSFGERLSVVLVEAALSDRGFRLHCLDAKEVVVTDGQHGMAQPLLAATRERLAVLVEPFLSPGNHFLIGGFFGATIEGEIMTFGRGGSDLTATLLGGLLQAREIHLFSDVSGVFSADPRLVEETVPLPKLTRVQAGALAVFGSKVLYPFCMEPLSGTKTPVFVRNTFEPNGSATLITHGSEQHEPLFAVASLPQNHAADAAKLSAEDLLDPYLASLCHKAQPGSMDPRRTSVSLEQLQQEYALVYILTDDTRDEKWLMAFCSQRLAWQNLKPLFVSMGDLAPGLLIALSPKDRLAAVNCLHQALSQEIGMSSPALPYQALSRKDHEPTEVLS